MKCFHKSNNLPGFGIQSNFETENTDYGAKVKPRIIECLCLQIKIELQNISAGKVIPLDVVASYYALGSNL